MFDLWSKVARDEPNARSINCDCNDPELPRDDEYSVTDTLVSSDNSGTESGGSTERSRNTSRYSTNESYPKKERSRGEDRNAEPMDEQSKELSTPHSKATPLFRAIEKQDWQGILSFLNTGKWSNSFFVSSTDHLTSPSPKNQCKTWVTAYEKGNPSGREEWSQLPLHAAISYGAPAVVIQKLIDYYPEALKKTDTEDMLPVHLAFGFSAPEQVLSSLLKGFPEGARQKGPGGRLPHECCELGPNKVRGEVFGFVSEQIAALSKDENDELYMICVRENYQRLGLPDVSSIENMELTELLTVLLEERKTLMEIKIMQSAKIGNNDEAVSPQPVPSPPPTFGKFRAASTPAYRRENSPERLIQPKKDITPSTSPSSLASDESKTPMIPTTDSLLLDVDSKLIRPPIQSKKMKKTERPTPTSAKTKKFSKEESKTVVKDQMKKKDPPVPSSANTKKPSKEESKTIVKEIPKPAAKKASKSVAKKAAKVETTTDVSDTQTDGGKNSTTSDASAPTSMTTSPVVPSSPVSFTKLPLTFSGVEQTEETPPPYNAVMRIVGPVPSKESLASNNDTKKKSGWRKKFIRV